jgi:NTE family protein
VDPGSEGASRRGGLALVLTGGGARAAYQVGVLQFLAEERPDLDIPILTGASAGSINASFLACRRGSFSAAAFGLAEVWLAMRVETLFRIGPLFLARRFGRWGMRLSTSGVTRFAPEEEGLVDTQPLRRFLEHSLGRVDGEFTGLAGNFERGALRAFAITAIDWSTGETVDWLAGPGLRPWRTPNRRGELTQIGVEHVMASTAIPILFPAARVDGSWYGDGGVRESDPLYPAAHLGANRILAVSTKPAPSADGAPIFGRRRYPPLAQILGVLSNAIFLDVLEDDFVRLDRHRSLVEQIPPRRRGPEHPVHGLLLRPSEDIGLMAARYEPCLPRTFRFLFGGLGTRETEGGDFISLVMFVPEYLEALIALGHRDATARGKELLAFVDG